jgi:hypothetical protein
LITTNEGRPPSIYVMDGWRHVVQLGADGTIQRRYPLPIPDDGAISFLRTNVDRQGRRYHVGTARLARQVHVLDQTWQLVKTYPDAEQKHDGIQDVQLVDLDADGQLELYVAFAGVVGLHRVDLTGTRQWSNRSLHSILSLAAPRFCFQPPRLLATSYLGQIVPVTAAGQDIRPVSVGSRAVHQLVASNCREDRPTMFCGISYAPDGRRVAIGMDASLREAWSYDLPVGVFRSQVQYVTVGRLLDGPGYQWVMAGPDGSIHIVADDGQFHDWFCRGEDVTGLAATELQEGKVLVIATRQAVSAWRITPRDPPAKP